MNRVEGVFPWQPRLRSVWLLLALVGCGAGAGGDEGELGVTLEILSPAAGETGSAIEYRVHRTGQFRASNFYVAAAAAPETVVLEENCAVNFGPTCEGTVALPERVDSYQVWAELIPNGEGAPLLTARQTVKINGNPVVATALEALSSSTQIELAITGQNDLDTSTLDRVRVSKRFAYLPYVDLPEKRDFGLRAVDVDSTASFDGEILTLTGEFSGPAFYDVSFEGVTNVYGMQVRSAAPYAQPFFSGKFDLGRLFVSAVGIPPRFAKAKDGRLFVIVNGSVRRPVGPTWIEVASWPPGESTQALIDDDGTPYIVEPAEGGARVSRWDGASWVALPDVPNPPAAPASSYAARAALGKDGAIYVVTLRSPTWPSVDEAHFYRWQGDGWQPLEQRQFAPPVADLGLVPFGESIAFFHDLTELEALVGDSFEAVASPAPVLDRLSRDSRYSARDLRIGADGRDYLLARYVDASQSPEEPAIPASGLSVLSYDGAAWQLEHAGTSLVQGWIEPYDVSSDLKLIEQDVRAWTLDDAGAPHVFTREVMNIRGPREYDNLLVGGYAFRDGAWGSVAGAPSPLLQSQEAGIPQATPQGTPVVIFDVAFDASGKLWAVEQVGNLQDVTKETFVLTSHAPPR